MGGPRSQGRFVAISSWLAGTGRLLSSWSFRVGLLLVLPILIYPPWRQEFMERVGEGDLVPIRAIRHRFIWDPPWNSEIAVGRLLIELLALVAAVMLAYQYERIWRQTRRPAKKSEDFSQEDWLAEFRQLSESSKLAACPSCERMGFYGPREDKDGRHLRLCMFCGFRQFVGGKREKLVPCVHSCGKVIWIAGAPRFTWVDVQEEEYLCEFCGAAADVQTSRVASPVDDPRHPWWDVPQDLSREAYVHFWLKNGAPGRAFL